MADGSSHTPEQSRKTFGEQMAEAGVQTDPTVAALKAEASKGGSMRKILEKAASLAQLDKYRANLLNRIGEKKSSGGIEPVNTRANNSDQQTLGESSQQNKLRQEQVDALNKPYQDKKS